MSEECGLSSKWGESISSILENTTGEGGEIRHLTICGRRRLLLLLHSFPWLLVLKAQLQLTQQTLRQQLWRSHSRWCWHWRHQQQGRRRRSCHAMTRWVRLLLQMTQRERRRRQELLLGCHSYRHAMRRWVVLRLLLLTRRRQRDRELQKRHHQRHHRQP